MDKVLIVDDEPFALEVVKEILDREGYQTVAVESGGAALQVAGRESFDLLLADIKMPQMNGLELIRSFQALSPQTVPILMTGYGSLETAREAIREGAYDYILKPFDRGEICVAVARALERKRLDSENSRLKELVGIYKLSRAVATNVEQRELLDMILATAVGQTGSDGGAIILLDSTRHRLTIGAASGAWGNTARLAESILRKDVVTWFDEGRDPIIFSDTKDHPLFDRFRHYPVRKLLGTKIQDVALVPIEFDQQIEGLMSIYTSTDGKLLAEGDIRLMSILAAQAGISIQSRSLFADIEDSCLLSLRLITSLVETKCPYLIGHMEQVADLSERLGTWIGLDEEEVRILKLGASLHDIGQIGISDAILNKPDELTPEEWDEVKRHPVIGDEILAPFRFLADARPIVRHHHERLDGMGYPDGLRDDELTPSMNVVILADAYSGMISPRPWGRSVPEYEAMQWLIHEKGTRFDPDITDAFIDMLSGGDNPSKPSPL